MKRVEFEVLAYYTSIGNKSFDPINLSNELKISQTALNAAKDELCEKGYLEERKGNLIVSEKGIEALEPYRVKRAVIFAAGFGSRMVPVTLETPKPMVKVHGVRIIDRLIDALLAQDITDITIVRGYLKDRFNELLEKYPFIKLIDNDRYEKENNISSALVAGEAVDNCYICAGDLLITNPNVIKKYHYCSDYLASYSLETDDWCFDMKDGCACNYRKGGTFCYNQYEIAYWNAEDSKRLREDWKRAYETPEGYDLFWEFIPLVLYKENYHVEIRPCSKNDIMEIDNFYELVEIDPSYSNYPSAK